MDEIINSHYPHRHNFVDQVSSQVNIAWTEEWIWKRWHRGKESAILGKSQPDIHSLPQTSTKLAMVTFRVLSIMPKIPEILIRSQMKRSFFVQSNQRAVFKTTHSWHWSTLRSPSKILCSILTNWFIALMLFSSFSREFGKEWKMVRAIFVG